MALSFGRKQVYFDEENPDRSNNAKRQQTGAAACPVWGKNAENEERKGGETS